MLDTIVVIGAGPAGLITAREAAKRGANVLVLEEHEEIGVPCHCAGLMSSKGLRHLGVPLSTIFIQNRLKGAHFHSPSGLSFTIEGKESVASVVDRIKFDKFLGRQTLHAGADIRLKSKVHQIERFKDRIRVRGSGWMINTSVVVDAEGLGSRFVKGMGLTPLRSEYLLPALQFELNDVNVDPKFAEIYVGTKIAPGFFAWVIPLNADSARVGLACKNANPRKQLESFVKDRFDKFDQISVRSGRVITHGPIPKTFDDNFVIVGDAAGQVKPTTGGGVILGGICASIAGKVAVEALNKGTTSSDFLRGYEKMWKNRLEREFKVMHIAREIMNRLSDKIIDKLFSVIIEKNLQNEISSKGDMDFQTKLLSTLAKKREFFKILLIAVSDIIRFKYL